MPVNKMLDVILHGNVIGSLENIHGDKNVFTFNDKYINNTNRDTLSLSFANLEGNLLTHVKPTTTQLPPFFSNLLPEGTLREYIANTTKISPRREFSLIKILGHDLPGAITIKATEQSDDALQEDSSFHTTNQEMRFSLAGVQLKFSASPTANGRFTIPLHGLGGSWIVKLPSNLYESVPENEYTMMELARKIGIEVPETKLIPTKELTGLPQGIIKGPPNANAYLIKRFDRTENLSKNHIEDFAQVFAVFPDEKYKKASYRNIVEVIQQHIGEIAVKDFIKRFVFNALIGNGDMHLKNWSLIYPDRKHPQLAPAYDFVSTLPYIPNESLALKFVDSKEFTSLTFEQFKKFAIKSNISEQIVLDTTKETIELFHQAWKEINNYPLPDFIRESINQHLANLPLLKF